MKLSHIITVACVAITTAVLATNAEISIHWTSPLEETASSQIFGNAEETRAAAQNRVRKDIYAQQMARRCKPVLLSHPSRDAYYMLGILVPETYEGQPIVGQTIRRNSLYYKHPDQPLFCAD